MRRAIKLTALLLAVFASGSAMAQGYYYEEGPRYRRPPPQYQGENDYGQQRRGGQICAYEGGFCYFRGYAVVRYGAGGSFVSRQARDGIPCSNRVFGDPAYGQRKFCVLD